MTNEEIRVLDMEQCEERAAAIAAEVETAEAEAIETLTEELSAIEERKLSIETEAEEKRAAMEAVIEGQGEEVEVKEERKVMNSKEVRALPEYIEAYAELMKSPCLSK